MRRIQLPDNTTERLAKGSEQAFQDLYHAYFPNLMRYGKAISDDLELIRDTIQDLFVWVWQNRERLVQLEQLDAYLYRAFRNNLSALLNQSNNRQQLLTIISSHQNGLLTEGKIELEEKEEEQKTKNQLRKLIDELPQKQREVIYLRYYEEKTYHEIAEILEVNTQVAQNYAMRALAKLREHSHVLEKLLYPALAMLLQFS